MRMQDPNVETVGNLEKQFGFPPGTFRNSDGRDTRSDKKIETIRKEWQRRQVLSSKRKEKRAEPSAAPLTIDMFSHLDQLAQAS